MLLVPFLRNLSRMSDIRVMCGAGRRGCVRIRLTRYQLRAWVYDDMGLFVVLQ